MASSQLDLIDLLKAIDPDAPRVERHLWLISLVTWIRGDCRDVDLSVARVRMLLDAVEVRPDWLLLWKQWWSEFLHSLNATALLADLGFAPRGSLSGETFDRVQKRIIPPSPDTSDLAELFPLLFPHEFDSKWLRALDARTVRRMSELLFSKAPSAVQAESDLSSAPDFALLTLLDALAFSIAQISAKGQWTEIRKRLSDEARKKRAFRDLPIVFETMRHAILKDGRHSASAVVEIEHLREQLDSCRAAASTVYTHLEEHGISVHIEFQLRQLRQRILRVKTLLLCLETDSPVQAAIQMLSYLVRVQQDSKSIKALIRTNTELLAAKVTERNAETGEHYITRNVRDYALMIKAASGGGALLAGTTWLKLCIGAMGLSAFFAGLAAGLNYAISFIIIMLLHWTVATKQPAMTAPAMAAKLKDMSRPEAVPEFIDEVVYLLRSQFAAILGNVGVVIPVVFIIGSIFEFINNTTGLNINSPLTDYYAHHIFEQHHLFGATIIFAIATGGLLFISSILAGSVENWFVFHRLDSVIKYHPRFTSLLGKERAIIWGEYWRNNISGYAANISLGLMLGLLPSFLGFFSIPFEVRHVTLVAGQLSAAIHHIGLSSLLLPELWWAIAGMLLTGIINVGVSFFLAFKLALAAQNIATINRRRIYLAMINRILHKPLSFILPTHLSKKDIEVENG